MNLMNFSKIAEGSPYDKLSNFFLGNNAYILESKFPKNKIVYYDEENNVITKEKFLEKKKGTVRIFEDSDILIYEILFKTNDYEYKYFYGGRLVLDARIYNRNYDGVVKYYSKNDCLSREISYANNQFNGWFKKYYDNCKLEEKTFYKKGRMDGESIFYHENGEIARIQHYSQDALDGISTEFDEYGVILSEFSFKYGKLNGKSKYYNPNGDIAGEFIYKNDLLVDEKGQLFTGKKIIYYENGNVETESSYVGGMLEGVQKHYGYDGKLLNVGHFEKNLLNGVYIEYDEEGKIISQTEYIDGVEKKLFPER